MAKRKSSKPKTIEAEPPVKLPVVIMYVEDGGGGKTRGRTMSKRPGDPGYAAGWCIHYRYNRGRKASEPDTCDAGVDYATFKDAKFGQRPCFLHKESGESSPDAWPCAQLRRPTPEEIALHEKWLDGRMNLMATVMQGIRPWRDAHQGQSASETVECPACKGRLHLSIASYNGHVHGHCETEHCASWME